MKLVGKLALRASLLVFAATVVSCAYGGAAGVGNEHVVITRNDQLLWGLLRKVYVCKVSPTGLRACAEGVSP